MQPRPTLHASAGDAGAGVPAKHLPMSVLGLDPDLPGRGNYSFEGHVLRSSDVEVVEEHRN